MPTVWEELSCRHCLDQVTIYGVLVQELISIFAAEPANPVIELKQVIQAVMKKHEEIVQTRTLYNSRLQASSAFNLLLNLSKQPLWYTSNIVLNNILEAGRTALTSSGQRPKNDQMNILQTLTVILLIQTILFIAKIITVYATQLNISLLICVHIYVHCLMSQSKNSARHIQDVKTGAFQQVQWNQLQTLIKYSLWLQSKSIITSVVITNCTKLWWDTKFALNLHVIRIDR